MGISVPPEYQPLAEIGRGSTGLIIKARHLASGRVCALKLIKAARPNPVELRRFQREARALILLKHPGVVEAFDVGVHEGAPYLALELIEGRDLLSVVLGGLRAGGPLAWSALKPHARAIAEALAYCHERGVVHRDIKPQNILIDDEGERAVLIDFGLLKAERQESENTRTLTQSNAAIGTPAFMAPEQFFPKGEFGKIGAASDIWGFGATLFFALAGRPPYNGATALEIAEAARAGDPPRLSAVVKATPPSVDRLVAGCLTRSAAERPTAAHILEFLDEVTEAAAPAEARGFPWLAAVGAVAAIALLVLALALATGPAAEAPSASPAPTLRPVGERFAGAVLVSGAALELEGLDGASVMATIDGRRVPVPASGALPLGPGLGPRSVVLSSGGRELERVEAVPIEDLKRFRQILGDVGAWSKATEAEQDGAVAWAVRRLGANSYRLKKTRVYRCGEQAYRIATLEHLGTGMELQLIPGGNFRARWPRSTRRRTLATQLDMELCAGLDLPVVTLMQLAKERELSSKGLAVLGELDQEDRDIAAEFLRALEDQRLLVRDVPETRAGLRRFFQRYRERLNAAESCFVDQPVGPFLIGRVELTRREQGKLGGAPRPGPLDLPAVDLNYEDVRALAAKGGFRLPSRVEWQYACAAGSKSLYFWGDDHRLIRDYCWYNENAERVRPGEDHEDQANAFGLIDMLGNACEWADPDWDRWVEAMLGSGLKPPENKSFRRLAAEHRQRLGAIMGANLAYGWNIQQSGYFYYTPQDRDGKGEEHRPPRYGARLALSLPDLLP